MKNYSTKTRNFTAYHQRRGLGTDRRGQATAGEVDFSFGWSDAISSDLRPFVVQSDGKVLKRSLRLPDGSALADTKVIHFLLFKPPEWCEKWLTHCHP